jgi:predicted O-methyltransferase YrrM
MNSVQYASTLINPDYKHVLEFGVYQGYTLGPIREALDETYKVFGFDSFEGLPEDWEKTVCMKGHFDTGGIIPDIKNVKFFKGWFEDTIPEYLKEADTIGLLHLDCDLYSSTKTIFDSLHPYIKRGTIIVFDEWFYHGPGMIKYGDCEQKAFYEYVIENTLEWEFIPFYDNQNATDRKIIKIL